ncbi:FimD/PapC N-terminal domain-containing protein, partial [Serratia liquefaciens]|uniref:FimD/PapC N-terminal domain-containing protein n=1 Tax=Serratia liquefaciens TaxID=614 RepID=UPI0022B9EDDF
MRRQLKRRTAVPRRLALLIALALGGPAQARDYFNPALLELDGPQQGVTSLATFEENGSQLPGDYRVDILVNDQQVDSRMLTFTAGADGQGLQPCLSLADLAAYGVRVAQFPALGIPEAACADLAAIPQASARLLFDSQQLALSIPQAALARQPRGYVPPSQWDEGITALLLNYSLSGASSTTTQNGSGGNQNSNSQYA